MLTFTSAQWDSLLAMYFWPFVRILTVLMAEPVLGGRMVPRRVKVALAVVLTLAITPLLDPPPPIAPASPDGFLVLVQQILIGVAIGFTMRLIFAGIEMAGSLIGLQMGLGFANFFDPMNSAQVPVVGQFFGYIAILLYFAIDGHLMLIAALAESFHILPISTQPLNVDVWGMLARAGGQIFLIGIVLSLPIVAVLLISNVALGIMTRAAPTLNLFAVGFPITLMGGMIIIYIALPYMMPMMERSIHDGIDMIITVLRTARPHA